MSTASPNEVEYPSSDGKPMAETGIHVRAIVLTHQALEDFFRARPGVFIASDMFWYPERGEAGIDPDVMVLPGVGSHDRRSFRSWEEGGAMPAVVFEMASEGTWQDDLEDKFDAYERLGVREYFLFDPEGLYLVPPLQGFRLRGGSYRRLRSPDRTLESELGFRLRGEGLMLRLIDSSTGRPILTRAEQVEVATSRADAAAARADAETARADAEKARADALAAELDQLRKAAGGGGP